MDITAIFQLIAQVGVPIAMMGILYWDMRKTNEKLMTDFNERENRFIEALKENTLSIQAINETQIKMEENLTYLNQQIEKLKEKGEK